VASPRRWLLLTPVVLVVALASPLTVAGEPDLGAAREAAAQASAAYEAGDYLRAVEFFDRAIAGGLDHPKLRYNLGNSYYKSGDLGRAILWYERARRDAPRDRAISHNLSQARSQMQDQEISSHAAPALLRPLSWLRDRLSLDGWSKLLVMGLFVLCAFGVWRHWSSQSWRGAPRLAAGLGFVVLVSVAMSLQLYREQHWVSSGIVLVEEADVHSGPGPDYDLAFRVHAGLKVSVGERRGDWARIDLGGDLVGWVRLDSMESL
jgi:tetratricopeptide (TPR) repeat protein